MYALPYILLYRLHRAALNARRKDRTWKFLLWSSLAGLLGAVLVGVIAIASVLLVLGGWWWLALVLSAMFITPILESHVVRHVLAPLGWYRAAFWVGHTVSMEDSDAGGLVYAAWAHACKPTPSGEAWIVARRDKRRPLGDAEVVVTALLAAARGDAATARQLMRSVLDMVEVHPHVREIAGEWLACDAIERGAFAELAADATAAKWPATSLTYLLEGIAMARVGSVGAPRAPELYVRWLLAPYRRRTRAWLAQRSAPAPQAGPQESSSTVAKAAEVGDAPERPLPRAIAAHVRMPGKPSATSFAQVVQAWDLALADEATRAWLGRRALELDAPLGAADRALREVTASVTDELTRAADAAALGAPPSRGLVGEALARRLRHGRLDALEAGFTRWVERRHDGDVRAPIDEWREWVALRTAYDAAVAAGGTDLRRLAFPHAYKTGTAMAAWLWNQRDEYALSHAVSTWLLGEAMAVGDTEAVELCTRNARLTVKTRTGRVG